ncbi:ribonuclease R [Bacteroides sp. Phil13]|uniref:ribonuclease R n=1 Tax=Bacteroides sp. Phil13 TaxID=1929999 RepID=UPI000AB88F2A|nr:ribonuclease R [Bacteroides sp. Phil13]
MDKLLLEQKKELVFSYISSKEYRPLKFKELVATLQVPRNEKDDLREVLESLVGEGKITIDVQGKFKVCADNVKVGTFVGNSKGFGFVVIEGEDQDIFVPENSQKGALHNDIVQVKILEGQTGKRREGVIVSIVERKTDEVVGTFAKSKNYGFVITDNQKFNRDIYIPKEFCKGAVTGHKVVVKITDYGSKDKKPEGRIVEILGHINDPGVDIMSIVKGYGLPTEFPGPVMKYIDDIPDEVDPKDISGRTDIRDWPMVTIDGEDAKDLDDAITLTKEGNVYKLGVHIADVSNYVKEDSVLDVEALKRGTSVYLVDRVIPMLPHKLSNGICSLNAGVDRLALSCFMDIDIKGNVIGHKIAETVVRVTRRMSYNSVQKILDGDEAERKEYEPLVGMFELMQELASILRERRRKRGGIDFDFPESKIILDEKGKPIEIKPYERNTATRIIEDFMLVANETVAEDYFWQEIPFVYRTHEAPDEEKIQKLGIFINNFGYTIKVGQDEIHPKEIQKLLDKVEGSAEEALISRLTLRSMKQAKYTVTNDGHFGLSTKYYCHFTSPIRRYPDLQIHRIIKENLRRGISEKRSNHYQRILPDVAAQSSAMERRADEAEREVDKLKKAQYMKQFIGETFEGVISSITTWGMYVELPNTCEGMIKVTNLKDDYYFYDEESYTMVGEHTKKVYKLGQKVRIVVDGVDSLARTVDFILAEDEDTIDTDADHAEAKED